MEERLQKLLAKAGYGSRRNCEQLIISGRVQVNGNTAELGSKADSENDYITVDLRPIIIPKRKTYIALYKPRGVLSTVNSNDTRTSILDIVPTEEKLFPVGRLDFDSEGLILLTNDGELANRLTHPRYGHEKEYRVLVARKPDTEQLTTWQRGVVLEDGHRTLPAKLFIETPVGKGAWLRIILKEGRKRQIRETGAKLGLPVLRIIRIRIGSFQLGNLKPGQWRDLNHTEIQALYNLPRVK